MSKIFEGKIGLKLFAIALAVMMAASVLPAAFAGQPVEHDHECAEHAHEGCECGHAHVHDACECGHSHGHDARHHHEGGPGTTLHSDEGATLLSAPAQPATSGFPVWLDAHSHATDGDEPLGFEPDANCPDCVGGWVTCGNCGGFGDVTCPTCGGSGEEPCDYCGGSGSVETMCMDCGGMGTIETMCMYCGGTGIDPMDGYSMCPTCSGSGTQTEMCTSCGGTGTVSETCPACSGSSTQICTECGGATTITCPTCTGSGGWSCTDCEGDGLIDIDHQLAQEFVPAANGQVEQVRVMISNPDAYPTNLQIYISDSSNILTNKISVPGASVGAAPQWIDIAFTQQVILTTGNTYYIVAEADDYKWWWSTSSTDPYPSGSAWGATSDTDWAPIPGVDMVFEVYLTTPHTKIYDVHDLQNIQINLSGNFLLMNDIDASETQTWNGDEGFVPIGTDANRFTGRFEGGGHTIHGLHINRPLLNRTGLFGCIGSAGLVNDTRLVSKVTGNTHVGGLVGENRGNITNCHVSGEITGFYNVGGFAGMNRGTIFRSYSEGQVASTTSPSCAFIGGFIGYHLNGNATECYSKAEIDGRTSVGGFAGYNQDSDSFNCYSTGRVTGAGNTGGFVADMAGGNIVNCYSTGLVYSDNLAGGLIGFSHGGTIASSFWDNETTGQAGSFGGTPKNTTEMKNQATFAGWDFANVWWMVDGQTRPFLRMEYDTEIRNSHQLQMMQMDLAADYTLANDIDLSDITDPAQMWGTSPAIGWGFFPVGNTFTGDFDGQGHVLSNLFINRPLENQCALFRNANSGSIGNLSFSHANITGYWAVGSLVGEGWNSKIYNVSSNGEILAVEESAAGIVGYISGSLSRIENCSSSGNVSGLGYSGGIAGETGSTSIMFSHSSASVSGNYRLGGLVASMNSGGTMFNCFATGDVTGTNGYVGGLVGSNNGPISSCYASGNVIGADNVGGFVGMVYNTITDCYARGNVTGSASTGGFAGMLWDVSSSITNCHSTGFVTGDGGLVGSNSGTVTDCFWDTETSDQNTSAGGVGKTTAEMMQQATFASWDFANIWGIVENQDYPVLRALCQADLEMDLQSNNPFANAGPDALTYTMYVTNHGPDTAFDVHLSLLLPAQMSPSSGTPMWATHEGRYVNYSLGNMLSGQTHNPYLIVNIDAYAYSLTAEATTMSSCGDPGEYPNHDSVVINVNRHPIANDDARITNADETLIVAAPGVLANDNDPDGDAISVSGNDAASTCGVPVAVHSNGSFTYNPLASATLVALKNGETMNDFFNYTITDGSGGWDTAMVTITVTGVNDPPVAANDTYTFPVGTAFFLMDVLANDNDVDDGIAGIISWTNGSHGSVALIAGKLNYTPASQTYVGTDTFNYTIADVFGATASAVVAVEITPLNRAPQAFSDTYTIAEDSGAHVFQVLLNDIDQDGDALTIVSVTQSAHGTVDITSASTMIWYSPNLNYFGEDSFTYTIRDPAGLTSTATVTVIITSVNDPPTIITTNPATSITVGMLYSQSFEATDVESDSLTWSMLNASCPWLSINPGTGLLSGTPTAPGTYPVNVTVSDGNGGIAWKAYSITVNPSPNAIPVISTNTLPNGTVGVFYAFQVSASDADGDTLAWAITTNATWLLSINATGYLEGRPSVAGTFWVLITVNDGNGGIGSANLTLSILESDEIVIVIGPVKDPDGNPIAGATVKVTINGTTYTGTTDADGNAEITVPTDALGQEMSVKITKDGYEPISYTTTLGDDGTAGDAPPDMKVKQSSILPYILVIIIVVAIIAAAVLALRPKKPKIETKPVDPGQEPPNFNTNASDANKAEPKENIAEDGATTYVESQTPYDRLG